VREKANINHARSPLAAKDGAPWLTLPDFDLQALH